MDPGEKTMGMGGFLGFAPLPPVPESSAAIPLLRGVLGFGILRLPKSISVRLNHPADF